MTKAELQRLLRHEISLASQQYSRGFSCTYCNRELDPPGTNSLLEATKDHVIPKSSQKRGTTSLIVWCCYQCNFVKGNMSWQSWVNFTDTHTKWWEKEKFTPVRGIGSTQPKAKFQIKKEETMSYDNNVIQLREPTNLKIVTGGKPPLSGNWLMDLPVGTRFTVKSKTDHKNFMCLDLELVNKTPNTASLYELTTGQPLGGTGRVVPSLFVLQFELVEKLPSYDEMMEQVLSQEETTETTDGSSNRSDKSDA